MECFKKDVEEIMALPYNSPERKRKKQDLAEKFSVAMREFETRAFMIKQELQEKAFDLTDVSK